MWRQNFYHALHVHAIGLPAFFDGISRLVKNNAIRKGCRAARVAGDKAILVKIHEVFAILRERADHREAREPPIEPRLGKLQGAGDERIRRRIGTEPKIRGGVRPKIETRLVDTIGRANHVAPVEKGWRKRKRGDTFHGEVASCGELFGVFESAVMGDATRDEIGECEISAGAAPAGRADVKTKSAEEWKKKQNCNDDGGETDNPAVKGETHGVGDPPNAECGERKNDPQRGGAFRGCRAIGVNPGSDLGQQNERGETKIDNEKPIPGDALLGNRIPHASAERGEAIEKNVAGDRDAVNDGEHAPRWRFEIMESGILPF